MSLKRLLNPQDVDEYVEHRPLPGWDEYGVSVEDAPVYHDPSWDNYLAELSLHATIGSVEAGHELLQEPFLFASEHLGPLEMSNSHSETISSAPTPQDEDEQICYGMIFRVPIRLCGDMAVLDNRLKSGCHGPVQGHYQMNVVRCEEKFNVSFSDGTIMGEVNVQLEKAFTSIAEQQFQIDFEVFAPINSIRETISRATKEKDAIVRVNVNIYGAQAAAPSVGRELSQHKIYLQRPDYVRPSLTYDNPHMLKLAEVQSQSSHSFTNVPDEKQPQNETRKAEEIKKTMSAVYSSLTRGKKLIGLDGDDRLKTTLLLHQKEALDFMSQRESGPIPEEYRLWRSSEIDGERCYRHAITNRISRVFMHETGGGILADEMGMGKTLSILALILRTLEAGHKWASVTPEIPPESLSNCKVRKRTRATLIIASSDLMINEWKQEMERHFHRWVLSGLRTVKYHGTNRETDVEKLCDADIIITTYHTLASDTASGKDPLHGMEWYRVVLDEAHIIRRQATSLYRTVVDLKARSRWCLTGTPVQNRLEDIGSLFAFLQASPFHTLSTFRQYIALPFDEGVKRRRVAIQRFTRLLDSLCLRRTKNLLHLPDQEDRVRHVEFSSEEREQYDQTKNMMIRAARNRGDHFDQKGALGMFQLQTQLRILCNHGTYQHPFSWNRRKLHLQDEREGLEASFGNDGEAKCSACQQIMPLLAGPSYQRFTEYCRHVVCSECMEESKSSEESGLPRSCPLCSSLGIPNPHSHKRTHSSDDDRYFRDEGKSSKMDALIADVQAGIHSTKSIIFSCWTHTLDLIEKYLKGVKITFRRIDGECPTSKRERILEDFARDAQLRVLIMTTGTGAVGLNLAMANRVFIVEPQWNPSVENQAIARALRLGQHQPVQVTRYVVNRTMEQEMRALQDRKLEIAAIAGNSSNGLVVATSDL